MLKNDTLKNGTSRIGLYESAPLPRAIQDGAITLGLLLHKKMREAVT